MIPSVCSYCMLDILCYFTPEHYSTVTIELVQEVDCTRLNLTQLGVPDSDYDRTNEGWHRYYWDSIKSTFGFGVKLF